MSLLSKNSLLVAAEDKVESGLTPENRADYQKIVVAGMKVGMANGKDSIVAKIKDSQDPLKDCAYGAINLCLMLSKQSRHTMPVKAMVPAAMTLMLNALSIVDRLGTVKIDNAALVKATHCFTDHIMSVLKITPQMMQHLGGKLDAITKDPANMEAINRKAGIVKDPRASTPTAVSEE